MKGTKRGLFIFPLNLLSFAISAVHFHFLKLEQIFRSYKESRVTLAYLYRTANGLAITPVVTRKDHGQMLVESAQHSLRVFLWNWTSLPKLGADFNTQRCWDPTLGRQYTPPRKKGNIRKVVFLLGKSVFVEIIVTTDFYKFTKENATQCLWLVVASVYDK